jgi:hypothetical protein
MTYMWITVSTLSISQRTLLPAAGHTALQLKAQSHARELLQSYASRSAVQSALLFLGKIIPQQIVREEQHLRLKTTQGQQKLRSIPFPYGLKGGAAREALISALETRAAREPRDIDLIRRGHHINAQDVEMACRFMPQDYLHGARVELVAALSDYLGSRDLSINEVAVFGDSIFTTLLCILDTIGHTIRPSRYRGGSLHKKPQLLGRTLLKMVRLYAEGCSCGEPWSLTGIPDEVSFSEFDFALNLNKAFQRGRTVAEQFVRTAEILALIPASAHPLKRALEELEHLRHGERGLFPDVPDSEWAR